jgi:hypothetical protein
MEYTQMNIQPTLIEQIKENKLCDLLTNSIIFTKVRLNLSLPKEFVIYIKDFAAINHQTLTGSVLSIITFHRTLHDFMKNGYKIFIEEPSGKTHYLLINAFV